MEKIPWRRKWQPTPVLLPRQSHAAWWAAVHEVAKRVGHNLVTKQQDLLQHWKYMIPIHPMIMNTYYVVSVGNTKMSKIQ